MFEMPKVNKINFSSFECIAADGGEEGGQVTSGPAGGE